MKKHIAPRIAKPTRSIFSWTEIGSDPVALKEYSEQGAVRWGAVSYPVEYLLGSTTWAAYHDEKMVAGFSFVRQAPLRTLSFLRPEMRLGSSVFRRANKEADFTEVAGIWYSSDVPDPRLLALQFWQKVLDAVRQGSQKYMIYGYNFETPGLQRFYLRFNPEVLYRGPRLTTHAPTGNTQSVVSIEAIPTSRVYRSIPIIIAQLEERTNSATSIHGQSQHSPVREPSFSPSESLLSGKFSRV